MPKLLIKIHEFGVDSYHSANFKLLKFKEESKKVCLFVQWLELEQ
jgi:hypothetical protein